MKATIASSFRSVDRSGQAERASQYLRSVSNLEAARAYKQRTFELLGLRSGLVVLDVGCGVGDDVRALASRVGPTGSVHGIDLSETLVAKASEHPRNPNHVRFQCCDATRLGYGNDVFDAVRADRVFQHLPTPAIAVRELVRVCQPGGRVVVSEPDWSTLSLSDSDGRAVEAIRAACCDRIPSPRIGSELAEVMAEAGVSDLSVTPTTAVFRDLETADFILELSGALESSSLSSAEANRLRGRLTAAEARGGFVATLTGFIVAGIKRPK